MGAIDIIKTEIDTDPLTRGYAAMNDEEVAADMNTVYRDGDTDLATLFNYMALQETYKTDVALDTQDRTIWERIKNVADITPWNTGTQPDPWGGGGDITEIRGIKCRQLFNYFTLAITGTLPLSMTNANFGIFLAGAQQAECMSAAQKDAIIALSQNQITRGQELGVGWVYPGHVQTARL